MWPSAVNVVRFGEMIDQTSPCWTLLRGSSGIAGLKIHHVRGGGKNGVTVKRDEKNFKKEELR